MLNTPAPFPQVGSYALIEEEGSNQLVRILAKDQAGSATVSFPLRPGASGTKTVPTAKLLDGTPLTDGERREMNELERGGGRRRSAIQRLKAFRSRDIHSAILGRLLDEVRRAA